MDRGLIAGAIGFVAAFLAERALASVGKDIARYDSIRKMSGQAPLVRELLAAAGNVISSGASKPAGFVTDLTSDAVRYAKMRGM